MESYNDSIHNLIYNVDASHLQSNEKIEVFFLNNRNEVIEVVKKAIKENKKVVCRGGGTNLVGNCLPGKNAIIIDLSKLNKILNKNSINVTVEPGLTTDELNEILNMDDLYFPVQLGSHSAAEIGGMVSTNGAGMRAIKYGKVEKWVEEIEVLTVDNDKEIKIQTLSHDEAEDFFGAEGCLGIILSIKLKLIKTPESFSLIFKSFDNVKAALDFVKEIKEKNEPSLSALEIINPQVSELLHLEKKYHILVEYEDNESGEIKDEQEIQSIREKRDACYAATVNAGYDQIEDPEINSNEEEFFKRFEERNIPIFGHIGIGVLHPHFKREQHDEIKKMYEMVQRIGGNVSGEHGIGKKKKEFVSKEAKALNEEKKRKRDPNNIFGF